MKLIQGKKTIKEIDFDYLSKIEYIQALGSYSLLKSTGEVFSVPLKYFELLLEKSWLRPNKSFLINPKFIDWSKSTNYEIVLFSDKKFTVSRRKLVRVKLFNLSLIEKQNLK
jgi:LytTr DNA-binding domain